MGFIVRHYKVFNFYADNGLSMYNNYVGGGGWGGKDIS